MRVYSYYQIKGDIFYNMMLGAHMIKDKRIEIIADEAVVCQHHGSAMYHTILQYQNAGIYREDV